MHTQELINQMKELGWMYEGCGCGNHYFRKPYATGMEVLSFPSIQAIQSFVNNKKGDTYGDNV